MQTHLLSRKGLWLTVLSVLVSGMLATAYILKDRPFFLNDVYYRMVPQLKRSIAESGFSQFFNSETIPRPVGYIDRKVLADKLKYPAPWALQEINASFDAYEQFSAERIENMYATGKNSDHYILFKIQNGQVSHQSSSTDLNGAMQRGYEIYLAAFEDIAKQGYVKNLTFILRLNDVTDSFADKKIQEIAPILGVAKHIHKPIECHTILIPDWMNLENWHWLQPKIDEKNKTFPWSKKINTVIWRGGEADISGFRHAAVDFAQQTNDPRLDVQFSFGANATAGFLPTEDHIQYKYQLNMDGHTAAWERPVWQLYSNAVMIKQDSPLIQWYYNAITPLVHYVPVKTPQDILDVINDYPDEVLERIAHNGHEFAKNHLSFNDMYAYLILVLQEFEKRQTT